MSAYDPLIYGCPCNAQFRQYEDLLRHRKDANHTGPSRCLICGLTFARAFNLKSHQLSHRPPSIRCPWCPTRVKRMTDLTRHRISCHAGESGRVYKCLWCESAFTRTDGRQRHLRSCVTRRGLVKEGKEEWVKRREEEVKKGKEWDEGCEMEARDLEGMGLDHEAEAREAAKIAAGIQPSARAGDPSMKNQAHKKEQQTHSPRQAQPPQQLPNPPDHSLQLQSKMEPSTPVHLQMLSEQQQRMHQQMQYQPNGDTIMYEAPEEEDYDDYDDEDEDELNLGDEVTSAPRWGVYTFNDTEEVTERSMEEAEASSLQASPYDTHPPTRASSETGQYATAAMVLEVRQRAGWHAINIKR